MSISSDDEINGTGGSSSSSSSIIQGGAESIWHSSSTTLYLKPKLLAKRNQCLQQQHPRLRMILPMIKFLLLSSSSVLTSILILVGFSLALYPLWILLALKIPSSFFDRFYVLQTWKYWILYTSTQIAATGIIWFLALCMMYVALSIRNNIKRSSST